MTSFMRAPTGTSPYYDAGTLDLPMRDQSLVGAAPVFPPFKFEPRRSRIDWRMLHGVDINPIIRDVDLDTLERVVAVIAFGDIEAEDTRNLTELNFVKVFRLSQLTVEYLLYVQDCLQTTNMWLQTDRGAMAKYLQAARLRVRELEAHLKMSKRELRRSRKTAKTYEAMTQLGRVGGGGGQAEEERREKEREDQATVMEAILRRELALMGERLGRAQQEALQLRAEREDMYAQVKEIEAMVAAPGAGAGLVQGANAKALQEQLTRAQSDLRLLRREKDELSIRYEAVSAEKKQLQDEKGRLLHELVTRPGTPPTEGAGTSARDGGTGLESLLMDAERQKQSLEEKNKELTLEVGAVRKQLMKAMKDSALKGASAGSASELGFDAGNPAMSRRIAELEKELESKRKTQADLEYELDITQQAAHDAQKKLADARRAAAQTAPGTSGQQQQRPKSPLKAGLHCVDEGEEAKLRVAELQEQNARLHEEVARLLEEKNELEAVIQRSGTQAEEQMQQMRAAWSELRDDLSPRREEGGVQQKIEAFERLATRKSASFDVPLLSVDSGGRQEDFERSFRFPASPPMGAASPPHHAAHSAHDSGPPTPSGMGSVVGSPTPPPLPPLSNEAEMRRAKTSAMERVAGQSPEQLSNLINNELRVITENPYEYEDDDEAHFKSMLPYEVPGRPGVRCLLPHTSGELDSALRRFDEPTRAEVDAQVMSFGLDPRLNQMSDREYVAMMLELGDRRQERLAAMPPDKQEAADFLRDALLTHIELMKRAVEASHGAGDIAHPAGGLLSVASAGVPQQTQPGQQRGPEPDARAKVSFPTTGEGSSGGGGSNGRGGGAGARGPSDNGEREFATLSGGMAGVVTAAAAAHAAQQKQQQQQKPQGGPASSRNQQAPPSASASAAAQQQAPPLSPSRATSMTAPGPSGGAEPSTSPPISLLNQSLTSRLADGPTPRHSVVSALDQSLKRLGADSARSSFNQSLSRQPLGGSSLNQSLGRPVAPPPQPQLRLPSTSVAAAIPRDTLNLSIRSTGSPSRTKYATGDDEDDSEESLGAEELQGDEGRSGRGTFGGADEDDDEDDGDDDEIDYGVTGGGDSGGALMDKIQAAAAAVAAGAVPLPDRAGGSAGGGQQRGTAGGRGWTNEALEQALQPVGEDRDSIDAGDVDSIHSFNMSETTSAIMQQLPAARGPTGWASPDATLRGANQSRLGAAAKRSSDGRPPGGAGNPADALLSAPPGMHGWGDDDSDSGLQEGGGEYDEEEGEEEEEVMAFDGGDVDGLLGESIRRPVAARGQAQQAAASRGTGSGGAGGRGRGGGGSSNNDSLSDTVSEMEWGASKG